MRLMVSVGAWAIPAPVASSTDSMVMYLFIFVVVQCVGVNSSYSLRPPGALQSWMRCRLWPDSFVSMR